MDWFSRRNGYCCQRATNFSSRLKDQDSVEKAPDCSICYESMRDKSNSRWLCHGAVVCNGCARKDLKKRTVSIEVAMRCPMCRSSYYANYKPSFFESIQNAASSRRREVISFQKNDIARTLFLNELG